MKKSIIFLFALTMLGACKKEESQPTSQSTTPVPAAQTNCMGSVWKYEVTANPAVNPGDVNIVYKIGDGYGTTAWDTTLSSYWSQSVTINQNLTGTQVSYPISVQVSRLKPIGTTTVTLNIYKNGVSIGSPGGGILTTNFILQTACQ